MLNFIDTYSFISVSVCVGMDPSALLFTGVYNAIDDMVQFSDRK